MNCLHSFSFTVRRETNCTESVARGHRPHGVERKDCSRPLQAICSRVYYLNTLYIRCKDSGFLENTVRFQRYKEF